MSNLNYILYWLSIKYEYRYLCVFTQMYFYFILTHYVLVLEVLQIRVWKFWIAFKT